MQVLQENMIEIIAQDANQVTFQADQRVADILDRHRVFVGWHGSKALIGKPLRMRKDARLEPYSQIYVSNALYTIGAGSYCHSDLGTGVTVGRFCSIAPHTAIFGERHPIERVSSSDFTYAVGPGARTALRAFREDFDLAPTGRPNNNWNAREPIIGNDVWIAADARLARGITIGHGAVVGIGAIVNKDVPPYAIVGGVPARLIRYRFPEAIIQRLLESEWWDYDLKTLYALEPYDDVQRFLDRFATARAGGLRKYQPQPLTWADFASAPASG